MNVINRKGLKRPHWGIPDDIFDKKNTKLYDYIICYLLNRKKLRQDVPKFPTPHFQTQII